MSFVAAASEAGGVGVFFSAVHLDYPERRGGHRVLMHLQRLRVTAGLILQSAIRGAVGGVAARVSAG